jgi:hypothetical protein
LVAFLRRMYDEDEQIARRACEYAEANWHLDEEFGKTVLWWPPEPRVAEKEREHGLPVVSDQWRGKTIESGGTRIAPHIARHDPARVLAEIEAKRRIMAEAFHHAAVIDSEWGCCHDAEEIEQGLCPEQHPDELPLLRLLALPYASYPGYRPEWAPGA